MSLATGGHFAASMFKRYSLYRQLAFSESKSSVMWNGSRAGMSLLWLHHCSACSLLNHSQSWPIDTWSEILGYGFGDGVLVHFSGVEVWVAQCCLCGVV